MTGIFTQSVTAPARQAIEIAW
jgi:PEP-CTERM motif-containing protein